MGEIERRVGDLVVALPWRDAAAVLQIAREADERIETLLLHVENLQRMNEGHCARIVAQSDLLTKRAETQRDGCRKEQPQADAVL